MEVGRITPMTGVCPGCGRCGTCGQPAPARPIPQIPKVWRQSQRLGQITSPPQPYWTS